MKRFYNFHNSTNSDEYKIWKGMKQRCNNPNNVAYNNYGGRGIKVCKGWNESFSVFLKDMGLRPSKRHSIDRINVNGDYKPSNCRWTTRREQCRNQRAANKNISGTRGVSLCKQTGKWAAYITLGGRKKHLGRYADLKAAIAVRKAAESKYWILP